MKYRIRYNLNTTTNSYVKEIIISNCKDKMHACVKLHGYLQKKIQDYSSHSIISISTVDDNNFMDFFNEIINKK